MTIAWMMPLALGYVGTPGLVLKAHELSVLTDANALLLAAEKRSADVLSSARDQKQRMMRQWRAQARYEVRNELLEAASKMQSGVAQLREALEGGLADFATVCVRKLLDESGAHAALEQRAVAIARGLLEGAPVEISVTPSVARLVRLAFLEAGLPEGGTSGVHVREDASLTAVDVMATTPAHSVDGRLARWLEEVHASALRAIAGTDSVV
jgi:flagellar biosynthesis/type III secretory pathway protein FliH